MRQRHEAAARGGGMRQMPEVEARGRGPRWRHEAEARGGGTRQRPEVEARGRGPRWRHEAEARGGGTRQRPEVEARGRGPRWRHEAEARGGGSGPRWRHETEARSKVRPISKSISPNEKKIRSPTCSKNLPHHPTVPALPLPGNLSCYCSKSYPNFKPN
ncbi:hypothetical protein BDZ91DRAFT_760326 [Kalaharituber pfeilii]|nr:hypothetical protein BDZ91DRAFT_760326 [Kalaharituber pfeilii]